MRDGQELISFAEIAVQGASARAYYIITAIMLLWLMLRLWNKLSGDRFDAWLEKATTKGCWSAGLYFCVRFGTIGYIVAKYIP